MKGARYKIEPVAAQALQLGRAQPLTMRHHDPQVYRAAALGLTVILNIA